MGLFLDYEFYSVDLYVYNQHYAAFNIIALLQTLAVGTRIYFYILDLPLLDNF